MDTVIFQGIPLSLADKDCGLSDDVIRLIRESYQGSSDIHGAETGTASSSRPDPVINLFSKTLTLLPIKFPDKAYITRRLEYPVIILTKEVCWQCLKKTLGKDPKRSEVFALSWAGLARDKLPLCHSERVEGHSRCRELMKVSDLIKDGEDLGRLKQFIAGTEDQSDNNNSSSSSSSKLKFVELDDEENPGAQFDKLCSLGKPAAAYWFQAFGYGFVWKKSFGHSGSSKYFRPLLKPIEYEEEKWFNYLDTKGSSQNKNIILVSGVAGMGKSTLLQKVAHHLKTRSKHKLVLFIKLQELGRILDTNEELRRRDLNILTFVHLLTLHFGIEDDLEKRILKCLMCSSDDDDDDAQGDRGDWREPKVEILFDGLDEMSRHARKVLLEYLKNESKISNKWSYRVWISTRPYLKVMVEEKFNIFAFTLDGLSKDDIMQLLTMNDLIPKSWARTICSPILATRLHLDLPGLLSVPRRLKSLACSLYSSPAHLKAPKVMSRLFSEAQKCYRTKYLNGCAEDKVSFVKKRHLPFAIRSFTSNGSEDIMGTYVEQELLDFGIITKNDLGQVTFVHPSFAAYLIAENFLSSHPMHSGHSAEFFLTSFLYNDECDEIRRFYDLLLMNGIKEDIDASWSIHLESFLIRTYELDKDTPEHDKVHPRGNVLQLALIDRRFYIAKMILRCFKSDHWKELRRLIMRKVRVRINNVTARSSPSPPPTQNGGDDLESGLVGESGNSSSADLNDFSFVELSSLSLAIMFADEDLVEKMYYILEYDPDGKRGDIYGDDHMLQHSLKDSYQFSPAHLAVIACNLTSLEYLMKCRHLSLNTLDLKGHVPLHLVFYNRWTLKFRAEEPPVNNNNNNNNGKKSSKIIRDIEFYKCLDNNCNDFIKNKMNIVGDQAGHLPLLTSQLLARYVRLREGERYVYREPGCPTKIWQYNHISAYLKIVEMLSRKTFVNFKPRADGIHGLVDPPLVLACRDGYLPIVKKMLEHERIKLNIRNKDGYTALTKAIFNGQVAVVDYLFERGIDRSDLNQRFYGLPVWHKVCFWNIPHMAQYLQEKLKWNVNEKIGDGKTPLHFSTRSGCLETTKLLIDLGANVNAEDKNGVTPLHEICEVEPMKCNLEVVRLLIQSGADKNARCKVNGHAPLHLAVVARNPYLVRQLLEYTDLNVNLKSKSGQTALHLACKRERNSGILKLLVLKGKAGVEVEDSMGQTPLMVFSSLGLNDKHMAIFLMRHGATLDHSNKLKRTPALEIEKTKELYNDLKEFSLKQLGLSRNK